MGTSTTVEIDGRQLTLTNLEKVLYPDAGFTKGEVIDYYARVAPAMLAHLGDRCVTFVRYPNGVRDKSFFEKRCPGHRPDWIRTAIGPGDGRGRGARRAGSTKGSVAEADPEKDSLKGSVKDSVKNSVKDAVRDPAKDAVKDSVKDSVKDPVRDPAKDAVKDSVKDSVKDPGRGGIQYCVLDDVPSLVWAANLAALEMHTPMARADDMMHPTMVVFDLDPGEPAGMKECAEVALHIRESLLPLGLELFPKTSGSKGLQVYLPLNTLHDNEHTRSFALAVAQLLEKHHPGLVLTTMSKSLRAGKVFIDWSQNAVFKTTICAYSLRARPRPTVSAPVTWQEVEAAAGGAELSFEASEVLGRVSEIGDLFGPVATLQQHLPPSR